MRGQKRIKASQEERSMGYNGPSAPFGGVEAKERRSENLSTNSGFLSVFRVNTGSGTTFDSPSLCNSLLNVIFLFVVFWYSWYLYDSFLLGFPYSCSFPKPQSQNP